MPQCRSKFPARLKESPMRRHFTIFALVFTTLVCAVSASVAQQQASCSFKLLKPIPGFVNGVNDYGTTVGQDASNYPLGFIRYANGSTSYAIAPNSAWTVTVDRTVIYITPVIGRR